MNSNLLKEIKVLLVEDEKSLAKLLKMAIGDCFYSFTITHNGKDGLKKFIEISPDIVITDIMMPDLTGLEMAYKIKKINPDIPIVILSAYSDKDKFLNAIDIGVVKYFIKPFDPDELLEYINTIDFGFDKKRISLIDGLEFNKNSTTLYKNNKHIPLSKRESQFLFLLLQNNQDIIDTQTIQEKLWENQEVSDERLRTFIKRLRLKTSKNLIQNIKGQGYQIVY